MLRPRIIPCLLLHKGGLVKTIGFGSPKYVGDPINAVRIFNEKEVDELMVVDIDATVNRCEPDYKLIGNLACECRMPLCYGGGVHTVEQIERIISLGVEKVAISSAAINTPGLVTRVANRVGSQSVVVVIDIKRTGLFGRYEVVTHNGLTRTGLDPVDFAREVAKSGAGEIVINSVDRDGTMKGYDHSIVDSIRKAVGVPMSVLGGAGSLADLEELISRHGIIGAAAGSIFVFKGKYRAVLINYPNGVEKEALYTNSGVIK